MKKLNDFSSRDEMVEQINSLTKHVEEMENILRLNLEIVKELKRRIK